MKQIWKNNKKKKKFLNRVQNKKKEFEEKLHLEKIKREKALGIPDNNRNDDVKTETKYTTAAEIISELESKIAEEKNSLKYVNFFCFTN